MCVCFVVRLLEKKFQVWKEAAQSEHDSLENRCTELEATMGVLIQHNQQLEQELGQVRHVSGKKDREVDMVMIISGISCYPGLFVLLYSTECPNGISHITIKRIH